MEAILGPDSQPFQTFISDHWSNSKEKRSKAEWMFNMMKQKDPESIALKLVDYLGPSHDIYYRERCAGLLRKLLNDNDLCTWHNLSVSTQSTIKSMIVDRFSVEEPGFIIQELLITVWTLIDSVRADKTWPELLPPLYQRVTNSSLDPYLKGAACIIFAILSKDIGETTAPCIKDLHKLFLNTLNDDTLHLQVRITAARAVITFIQSIPSSNEKERFQELLPGMMRALTDTLNNKRREDAAEQVLLFLIKLAKNEPRFLRRQLVDVVGTMFDIAEDKSLEETTRHLAIEFVLALVEAREKAPGMMKKLPLFTTTCFAVLLNLLRDIKDKPSWHSSEIWNDQAGVTDNYIYGRECLSRFSKALGGKTIAPIALEQLDAYLIVPEWEKRHAALIALSQIAEGSSKVMMKYLEQIMNMVLHAFQDPHPRVRWAAINAVAQFSIDFSPHLQVQYHNFVLPALAAAMDDFQHPRVQAHAALAVSDFCKSDKPETLVPYLDRILNKQLVLLQNDNEMVQRAALKALSGIADLSKEQFQAYYDFVMPYLKTIRANANDKSNHKLQVRAFECISLVALAVGKEKFRDDLEQVMEVLKSFQKSQVREADTIVYILQASNRICQCIGKDFLPYMSTVMPSLVECAQFEPDKTVSTDKLYDSIHKVKFGKEMICIKGSDLLEVKSIACGLLGRYAHNLKEEFYPWISQAASVLAPLLKFYMDDDVRNYANYALSSLLPSAELAVEKGIAQGGNQSYFKQLSGDIILALGNALYSESEAKISANILWGLNECLLICGSLLNEDQVHSIIDEIKHVLMESSRRNGELTKRAKSEDFDAEEAELLRAVRELEDEVCINVGNILITLIHTFKAAFLPFFDELSLYLLPMMGKDKTAAERSMCFHVFDILVVYCGEAALKYYNIYLPFLLNSSDDEKPVVRQNALYGLGLCAEHGGSVFKPFVGEALSRINVVITHLHDREPENLSAYYNAAFALGKICQFHQESIDSAQIIPSWLNCLPIKEDTVKAKVVHKQLCSMVERSDGKLLGPNYQHLPKVISVFVEVLCAGENLAADETKKCMINLLRHFQQTVPATTLASACSLLLPQHEMELESILSPEEDVNISTYAM
nr:PREDICTED: importin-5-like isoform X2 [Nicotiana tabacum]